jgi:hypothetical protein
MLTTACSTGRPPTGADEQLELKEAESTARALLASNENTKHLSTAGHLSSRLQVEAALLRPLLKRAATRVAIEKRRRDLERSKIDAERARKAKQIEEYRSRATNQANTSDRHVAAQSGEIAAQALVQMERAWTVQVAHSEGAVRAAEAARDESANILEIIARARAMLPASRDEDEMSAAIRDVLERLTGKESVRSASDLGDAVADAIRECEREIASTEAEMQRARTEATGAPSNDSVTGDRENDVAAEIAASKVAAAALARVGRLTGRMREIEAVRRQLDVLRGLLRDGDRK